MDNTFSDLLKAYVSDSLSPEQESRLILLLEDAENRARLDQFLEKQLEDPDFKPVLDEDRKAANLIRLQNRMDELSQQTVKPAPRVHFLRKAWTRYAAAILLLVSVAAYLWISNKKVNDQVSADPKSALQNDIGPGGDKAILTLADGRSIVLDSIHNGNVANQGSTQIVKLANGQIRYEQLGKGDEKPLWNTISTPKGGQYHVILPDGTRVLLNAASSITFPAVFANRNREVTLNGEGYFEVTHNPQKPFIVSVGGKLSVEVLGTSFNINSYGDEPAIKTTLIEGSVKIKNQGIDSALLKPGHQAIVLSSNLQAKNTGTIQVQPVDTDHVLAWKNGYFNLEDSDLRTVIRQIERWYDITVRYEHTDQNIIFQGKIVRNTNLSVMIQLLQKMGVKCRLEGRVLIVS